MQFTIANIYHCVVHLFFFLQTSSDGQSCGELIMSDSDSSFSEVGIAGASLLCNRVVTACGRVTCSALIFI